MIKQYFILYFIILHHRWDGGNCIDSPGSNHNNAQFTQTVGIISDADDDNSRYSKDDFGVIFRKIFGPIGMLIVILVIIGVCIVFHNKKYVKPFNSCIIEHTFVGP